MVPRKSRNAPPNTSGVDLISKFIEMGLLLPGPTSPARQSSKRQPRHKIRKIGCAAKANRSPARWSRAMIASSIKAKPKLGNQYRKISLKANPAETNRAVGRMSTSVNLLARMRATAGKRPMPWISKPVWLQWPSQQETASDFRRIRPPAAPTHRVKPSTPDSMTWQRCMV